MCPGFLQAAEHAGSSRRQGCRGSSGSMMSETMTPLSSGITAVFGAHHGEMAPQAAFRAVSLAANNRRRPHFADLFRPVGGKFRPCHKILPAPDDWTFQPLRADGLQVFSPGREEAGFGMTFGQCAPYGYPRHLRFRTLRFFIPRTPNFFFRPSRTGRYTGSGSHLILCSVLFPFPAVPPHRHCHRRSRSPFRMNLKTSWTSSSERFLFVEDDALQGQEVVNAHQDIGKIDGVDVREFAPVWASLIWLM